MALSAVISGLLAYASPVQAVEVSTSPTGGIRTNDKPPQVSPAAASKACAEFGKSYYVGTLQVPTCVKFWSSSAAIRMPADTASVVYGRMFEGFSGGIGGLRRASGIQPSAQAPQVNPAPGPFYFITRNDRQFTVAAALVPQRLRGNSMIDQFIFKATLRSGRVTALRPMLFVPLSTMVKPFAGREFTGTLSNLSPTAGIADNATFRWDFAANIKGRGLAGTFTSLKSTVVAWNMMEPPRPICANALLADDLTTSWYSPVLGSTGVIRMEWVPAMHAPGDSEFVVFMDGGASFMSSAPTLDTLLRSNIKPWEQRTFTIHGNPIGTPYSFAGQFMFPVPASTCTDPFSG